ncbi:MAG: xylose isomerase [Methanomicrobiales archaeon HGW-Methanomicrobiales-1]|jgi:sugar phosphate isomerase/epimerase|nr:MAG: xylose isomerase [Methanomicrobiales archaeon HGW-Methanomicrobiales-1]
MFGVSTFCLHAVALPEALDRLSSITGYIEVMDEGLHHLSSSEPLESCTARFSIHTPCRGTNIASLLEPIRRASIEVMQECFAIAAEVNAPLVIHPGYFAWAEERDKAEKQLQQSLLDLKRLSQEYSVPFFIENMGNWEYFFLKTPAELPLIGPAAFALDVGHAHLNQCLPAFLRYPAGHYHLHDNRGKEDSHDAVGAGTIDFKEVMAVVKNSAIIPILEISTFDGVLQSIEYIRAL